MARYNLGKATTPVSSNVSQDVLYLDTSKSEPLVADMKKQYKIMVDSATQIANYATKLTAASAVKGNYDTVCKTLANTCKSRAKYAESKANSLTAKYDEDAKDYTIKLLQDKLTDLESRLASLESAAEQ